MDNYSYQNNILIIGTHKVEFLRLIRDAKLIDDKIIVLLEIPADDDTINNLYAICNSGEILWQAEDLRKIFGNQLLLPYEQMVIENKEIRASDFYGRRYFIDSENGKVIKRDITK